MTGACLFLTLTLLFLITVPAVAGAQSGNGGTTEVKAQIKAPSVTGFTGHSINLNGSIGVNFYLNLTEEQAADNSVSFTWIVEGKEKTATGALKKDTKTGYYKASCPIAVAEMTYNITATVTVGSETLTDTYSAVAYANTILSQAFRASYLADGHTAEEYNKLADLVKAMLSYGAKAQAQFDRDTAHPADSGIDYTPIDVTAAMIGDTGASDMSAGLAAYGLEYEGTTVVFLSETSIRHYYRITDPAVFAAYSDSIFFNGSRVDYTEKGSDIYFELKNVSAPNLDTLYTLKIGNTEYKYSVLDYVKACLNSDGITASMKALAKATYLYNQAANSYFGR